MLTGVAASGRPERGAGEGGAGEGGGGGGGAQQASGELWTPDKLPHCDAQLGVLHTLTGPVGEPGERPQLCPQTVRPSCQGRVWRPRARAGHRADGEEAPGGPAARKP